MPIADVTDATTPEREHKKKTQHGHGHGPRGHRGDVCKSIHTPGAANISKKNSSKIGAYVSCAYVHTHILQHHCLQVAPACVRAPSSIIWHVPRHIIWNKRICVCVCLRAEHVGHIIHAQCVTRLEEALTRIQCGDLRPRRNGNVLCATSSSSTSSWCELFGSFGWHGGWMGGGRGYPLGLGGMFCVRT